LLTFLTMAQGVQGLFSDVRSRIEGIVGNLIDLLKQIVNQVYAWFYRFWNWAAEHPLGLVTLIANFWVIMS